MMLLNFVSKHATAVYIEKGQRQDALYIYKDVVKKLSNSAKMSDRKVKAGVKYEVTAMLPVQPRPRVIPRLHRTYFSWYQDFCTPLVFAAIFSAIGWWLMSFAASQPEETRQLAAEMLGVAVFIYAGTIAARAFGSERNRNPSSLSVVLKTLSFMLYLGALGWVLTTGGNKISDEVLKIYGGVKSIGLSLWAPEWWAVLTSIGAVAGGLSAFLRQRRKRLVINAVDMAVKESSFNIANRP